MRSPVPILAAVTLAWAIKWQPHQRFLSDSAQSPPTEVRARWESIGATIVFPIGSSDLDVLAMQSLDGLGVALSRARAESVVVQGLANEHQTLVANLKLAERRAQAVTRYLAGRGIGTARYVAIGRESAPDDPQGRRCTIEPVR